MRKGLLRSALGEREEGCGRLPTQERADVGEFSTFPRPCRLFLHDLTLSSVQKLCNFSKYYISSSSNAFRSSDRVFLSQTGLSGQPPLAENIKSCLCFAAITTPDGQETARLLKRKELGVVQSLVLFVRCHFWVSLCLGPNDWSGPMTCKQKNHMTLSDQRI